MQSITRILALFIIVLLCMTNVYSQTNSVFQKTLFGIDGEIFVNNKDTLTDLNYEAYPERVDSVHQIKNYVILSIDEESGGYIPSDFAVTLNLLVTLTDHFQTIDTAFSLTINYRKDSGQYIARSYFEFENAVAFSVKIVSIDSNVTWNASRAVKLESRIVPIRDWQFDCNATVPTLRSHSIDANEWLVKWGDPQNGHNEFDLEWAWVDSSAINNYMSGVNIYNLPKIFHNNSSRVTITGNSYKIPMLYDGKGFVFVRVRPAQIRVNGQRVEGVWTYHNSQIENQCACVFIEYSGFEKKLNWQATTSYAEDGKRKSVVQFFDGTLRGRQTVTKDNTTDTTVIAESFYDYQGRPVIQILPAPSLSNMIAFTKGFNEFDDNAISKSAYDKLDLNTTSCEQISKRLSLLTGAGNYYSVNNPSKNISFNKFIPDANGYAYTEIRYSNDGTGRIDAQGGVGETFQINRPDANNRVHDTKYYYESPSQFEIDGLFGTDAGYASHYSKNWVRDANGQYSVSYVDYQGRTVITALAGGVPEGIDTLASYSSAEKQITRQLIDESTNRVSGRSVISSKSLVVPKTGSFTFEYSFSPENFKLQNCEEEEICYDCLYDLKISIISDCNGTLEFPDFANPVFHKNFTPGEYLNTCNLNGTSPQIKDSFTVILPEGAYTIVKELTLSSDAQSFYSDSVFLQNNTCKSLEDYIDTQYNLMLAQQNCNVDCNTCTTSLGTFEDYKDKFKLETGYHDSVMATLAVPLLAAYNEAKEMCERLCRSETSDGFDEIRSIREIMLMDVSPSGQYANHNTASLNLSIFRDREIPWIFSPVNLLPFQHPSEYTRGTGISEAPYKDVYGIAVQPLNAQLNTLTPQQFSDRFVSSYAEQLLVYHPEFCKLQVTEDNLRSAYRFAEMMESVDTWAEAHSKGYIYQILDKDSFLLNSSMPGWSYRTAMQNAMNTTYQTRTVGANTVSVSMWKLAQMVVFCRSQMEAHPNSPGHSSIMNCINALSSNAPTNISGYCASDLNMVWRVFKGFYLTYRRGLIDTYLNTACPQATSQVITGAYAGYVPRFVPINVTPGAINTGYPEIDNYVNNTSPTANTTMMNQQADSTCRANAGNWLLKVRQCKEVESYIEINATQWLSDSVTLVENLVNICKTGVDYMGHPFGASTLPSGAPPVLDADPSTGQYYSSFPQIVRYFLEEIVSIPISEICHPYLIDYPATYQAAPPLVEQEIITKPSDCECARIVTVQEFYEQWQSAGYTGTFSDYLLIEHGTYLPQDSIQFFIDLCNGNSGNCTFLDAPVILPSVFHCKGTATPEKTCIGCSDFETIKNDFETEFGFVAPILEPQDESDVLKNTTFAQYANYVTGFRYLWTEYVDFAIECELNGSFSCTILDSALTVFLESSAYSNSTSVDSCRDAFTSFMNNTFGVFYTFHQWLATFNEECSYIPNICQPSLTCTSLKGYIDSFYTVYGVTIYQNVNAQQIFTTFMNDLLGVNQTYNYYSGIYGSLCGCNLEIGQFPDCYQLSKVYTMYYDSIRTIIPPPDESVCKDMFVTYFLNYFDADLGLEWGDIEDFYKQCVNGNCGPDIEQLCVPAFSCNSLEQLIEIFYLEYGDVSSDEACLDYFVQFFNDRFGLSYTYWQIADLYEYYCQATLPVCKEFYNCSASLSLISSFKNTVTYTNENCEDSFKVYFNHYYETNLSFSEIADLYNEWGCGELTLCEPEVLIFDCWQIQELLNDFLTNHPTPAEEFSGEGGCKQAFMEFFNYAFNSNYSFNEINNYFLVLCEEPLEFCGSQCDDLEVFVNTHITNYGGIKVPLPARRQLFTLRYNNQYLNGGTEDYNDIEMVLSNCNLLPPMLSDETQTYSLYDEEVLLALRTTYYLLRPSGLPVNCMNDFASWFNVVTGQSLNYEGIKQLYDFVVGAGSGNICNPSAQESIINIGYGPGLNLPPGGPRLCGNNTPVFAPPAIDTTSCPDLYEVAVTVAEDKYQLYTDSLRNVFDSSYYNKCLQAGKFESLTVKYTQAEYHYTLYYYDQAGNLVATVPPEGVDNRQGDNTFLNAVTTKRNSVRAGASEASMKEVPLHSMVTAYRYNTLNQVVEQFTPDGGKSRFWYDVLGRLVLSSNAKQAADDKYSYTLYDPLGRITEVGEVTNATVMSNTTAKAPASLAAWLTGKLATDITRTGYDLSYFNGEGTLCDEYLCQQYLRNRVSYTAVYESGEPGLAAPGEHTAATYYSYDLHGNVQELLQDINQEGFAYNMDGPDSIATGNRFKKIKYDYDLISGKVNEVQYQPGEADAFYHRYYYDAENRITDVQVSEDKVLWENVATYDYYRHGPLAKTITGQQQIQSVTNIYTLQGWLKGTLEGDDSDNQIAKQAFNFGIHYFEGDYAAINGSTPFASTHLPSGVPGGSLYNGNISAMKIDIPKIGEPVLHTYKYDQLNRIKEVNNYNSYNPGNNIWTSTNAHKELLSFDANGNIQTALLNGSVASLPYENFTYTYDGVKKNRLLSIHNSVGNVTSEYEYDEIGNVIKDELEGNEDMEWNVYGKLKSLTKIGSGTAISFGYDASGNRISKKVGIAKQQWYVRDATGNIMATYVKDNTTNGGDLSTEMFNMYGSSMLGSWKLSKNMEASPPPASTGELERGYQEFYFSNHLGNNLVILSDRKEGIQDVGNPTQVTGYEPYVLSATDYSAYGENLIGREYNPGKIKFGFNGKWNDFETGYQDYGMRMSSSKRRGFVSVDPLYKEFPWYSPYQFAGNDVIRCIDLEGGEPLSRVEIWDRKTTFLSGASSLEVYDKSLHRTFQASGVIDPYTGKMWIVADDDQGQRQYFYLVNDDGASSDRIRTYYHNGRNILYGGHFERFETENERATRFNNEIANAFGVGLFGATVTLTALPAMVTIGGAPLVGSGSISVPALGTFQHQFVKGLSNAGADFLTQMTLNDGQPINLYSISANFIGGFLNLNTFTTAAGASFMEYKPETDNFGVSNVSNFLKNTAINGAFGSLTNIKNVPWSSANFSSNNGKLAAEGLSTIPSYWIGTAGQSVSDLVPEVNQ